MDTHLADALRMAARAEKPTDDQGIVQGQGNGDVSIGVPSGDAVRNLALGVKFEGQPWRVGVTDPNAPTQTALSVALTDACIATSGSSQRFIEINGQRYSHFLNPKTGHPVEGCFSVSVIADSCLIAGGLATIACLMGATKGKTWLASSGLPWLIIEENQWTGPISDHYSSEQSTEAPQRNVPSPR